MDKGMTFLTQKAYIEAVSDIKTVSEAVEFLEKEAKVRTVREKIESFSRGQDINTVLVKGLMKHDPDRKKESVKRLVRGWLNNPAKQTLKKKDAIEISFILGLSVEEADEFVASVAEEGLHWRNPEEIVYIFALKQGMDYLQAQELNKEMSEILSGVEESKILTEDSFTPVIRSQVTGLHTKEELADYLKEAVPRLGRCHNNAYKLFMEMMDTLQNPRIDEKIISSEVFKPETLTIREILKEYLFQDNVKFAKDKAREDKESMLSQEDKFVLSLIQKNISDNWPDETRLSNMKSRKEDVTRKVLILLFLATDEEVSSEDSDDLQYEFSKDEAFKDLYQRLNDMLTECGFRTLDPRAPFDWLIIYCICAGDIFDITVRMKAVFREMFGEKS